MATYLLPVSATGSTWTTDGLNKGTVYNKITVATTDLALNAVMTFGYLPPNAMVTDVVMHTTDLDTGGSPALVFDVGTVANTDLLIDGTTIGQTGGTIRAGNVAGAAITTADWAITTAPTALQILTQVAAATAATGTISIAVDYIVIPQG